MFSLDLYFWKAIYEKYIKCNDTYLKTTNNTAAIYIKYCTMSFYPYQLVAINIVLAYITGVLFTHKKHWHNHYVTCDTL